MTITFSEKPRSSLRRVFDNRALTESGYFSKWTRNKMIAEGTFPGPDLHIGNKPYWYRETLEGWERKFRGKRLPSPKVANSTALNRTEG
jgi:hypothetical protein